MLKKFFKREDKTQEFKPKIKKFHNSFIAQSGEVLLQRQKNKLLDIRKSLSVTEAIYQQYYHPLFVRLCSLAQNVPASENNHHSNEYGYIDHVFECVVLALRKQEGFVYRSEREDFIMSKKDVFTYATVVGALLHDLGKLVTDIEFRDVTNERNHSVVFGALEPGLEYIYRFYPSRNYADHRPSSLLAVHKIIPEKALNWIQEEGTLYRMLIHTLAGDYNLSGELGKIVREVDKFSTQQNLSKIADKFSNTIQSNQSTHNNYNDLALGRAQQDQAKANQNTRAAVLAGALLDVLNRHSELANGKSINEKGGFAWVTVDYIRVVVPRCYVLIKNVLDSSNAGIKISQESICYQILFDAGFIVKINDRIHDYHTIDPTGWNKSLPMITFKRKMIDPQFALSESTLEVFDTKSLKEVAEQIVPASNKQDLVLTENDAIESLEMGEATCQVDESLLFDHPVETIPPPFLSGAVEKQNEDKKPIAQRYNVITESFLGWLSHQLKIKSININKVNAPVHFVNGCMCLISPIIFQKFLESDHGKKIVLSGEVNDCIKKNKQIKSIQYKIFESQLHHKTTDFQNILEFESVGQTTSKSLSGILLKEDVTSVLSTITIKNSRNIFLKSIVNLNK